MGTVHSYDTKNYGKLYRVAYKRPDGTQTNKRGFKRKRDAENYLTSVESAKLHGAYIAPGDSLVKISTLGANWILAHKGNVKPSTFHSDESAWRVHVEPKWGQRSVGTIRHTEVQTWVSNLAKEKSPTTVNRVHGVLASILDGAVQDKRIAKNPARDIKLPTKRKAKKIYLTHLQVDRLSKASKYPDFILFIAYSGLRWGEATGLRVGDVDRTRRRAQIEENAVNVNGRIQIGTPKSNERRSIVYPAFLNDAIKRACENKRPEDLLWPSIEGKHLRSGNMDSGWFIGAVKRVRAADEAAAAVAEKNGEEAPPIMPRVTPHDLRHTAASLAISAGANVKALQRMLGHASAAMTLDRYADLFEDDLDSVAEALDRHRTLSLMTTP